MENSTSVFNRIQYSVYKMELKRVCKIELNTILHTCTFYTFAAFYILHFSTLHFFDAFLHFYTSAAFYTLHHFYTVHFSGNEKGRNDPSIWVLLP